MGWELTFYKTFRMYENTIPIHNPYFIIDRVRVWTNWTFAVTMWLVNSSHQRKYDIVVKNMVSRVRPKFKLRLPQLLTK